MTHREIYLNAMTETVCNIMKKPEITQQDIQFIMLYKSELKSSEHTPLFKRIMSYAKEMQGFLKTFNSNQDEQKGTINTNEIEVIEQEEEEYNANTDAL